MWPILPQLKQRSCFLLGGGEDGVGFEVEEGDEFVLTLLPGKRRLKEVFRFLSVEKNAVPVGFARDLKSDSSLIMRISSSLVICLLANEADTEMDAMNDR